MKKAIVLTILCLCISLFLATSVAAAASITINNVALGGDDQERSNPDSRDDAKKHIRTNAKTLTVKNDGNVTFDDDIEVRVKSLVYETNYDFAFKINDAAVNVGDWVTISEDDLEENGEVTFTLSAEVVADLDAVDTTLTKFAPKIAVLEARGNIAGDDSQLAESDATMEAENKLRIDDIEVCLNSEDCDSNIDDNDDVEDVKPGDRVDVDVRVENRFSDSRNSRVDIEDVEVRLTIDDDEVDEDMDEDINDLNARDDDSVSFDFDIDDDADGDVEVEMEVDGTTEFGARMGEKITFTLEIERQNHEIRIQSVTANPSVLSCGGSQVISVRTNIKNIGKRDEDEVTIKVSSDRLDIVDQFIRNIELDEDDRLSRSFTFTVPAGTERGVYALTVETFYDRDEFSDSKEVTVSVPDCGQAPPPRDTDRDEDKDEDKDGDKDEDKKDDRQVVVIQQPPQPPTTTQPPVTTPPPTTTPRKSGTGSSGVLVGVLVGVVVLLLIIGVILIVAMATKKPRRPHM